jgi:hypothetical protein
MIPRNRHADASSAQWIDTLREVIGELASSQAVSKIMAPTSCFTGQVHRLPDAPETYGAMITRANSSSPKPLHRPSPHPAG